MLPRGSQKERSPRQSLHVLLTERKSTTTHAGIGAPMGMSPCQWLDERQAVITSCPSGNGIFDSGPVSTGLKSGTQRHFALGFQGGYGLDSNQSPPVPDGHRLVMFYIGISLFFSCGSVRRRIRIECGTTIGAARLLFGAAYFLLLA